MKAEKIEALAFVKFLFYGFFLGGRGVEFRFVQRVEQAGTRLAGPEAPRDARLRSHSPVHISSIPGLGQTAGTD